MLKVDPLPLPLLPVSGVVAPFASVEDERELGERLWHSLTDGVQYEVAVREHGRGTSSGAWASRRGPLIGLGTPRSGDRRLPARQISPLRQCHLSSAVCIAAEKNVKIESGSHRRIGGVRLGGQAASAVCNSAGTSVNIESVGALTEWAAKPRLFVVCLFLSCYELV